MRTSSAKAKGRRCCQEVKELLLKYAMDLEDGDVRVTPSGCTGEDILLSPAAKKIYPFAIECKNQEALNIWESLHQAESHAIQTKADFPLLFFRRNHSKLYMAMEAESFLKLIR